MNKEKEAIRERLKKYVSSPSHEKTSVFLLKRPKYMRRFYNSLCSECSIRVRQEILVNNSFKVDNELSFFCDGCKYALLPLLEKVQFKCEELYNK